MKKKLLVYVEENENCFSRYLVSDNSINLILIRFKQNMQFSYEYLEKTKFFNSFIIDKTIPIENTADRFIKYLSEKNLRVDYFFNDSEFNQELAQQFARLCKLPGALTKSQSEIVRNKLVMKEFLKKLNLNYMDYSNVTSLDDVEDFFIKHDKKPIIIKWIKGVSSIEVYKVENLMELKLLDLCFDNGKYMVEKFCDSTIWCIDAVVSKNKAVEIFLTWLPYTNLDFANNKERFLQISLLVKPQKFNFDYEELVSKIIEELGTQNGYLHLEVFLDQKGLPIICEFAWRTSGDNILSNNSYAFDLNVCELLKNALLDEDLSIFKKNSKCIVADMFLPIKSGRITNISFKKNLLDLPNIIGFKIKHKKFDEVYSKKNYMNNSGWIQIYGDTVKEVLELSEKIYNDFVLEVVEIK